MDLIFRDGAKVINKQAMDIISRYHSQATIKNEGWELKSDYNIYGDDFKIELEGSHGECILVLKDYDEHQALEYKTVVTFDKKEVNQLIAMFTSIRDKM